MMDRGAKRSTAKHYSSIVLMLKSRVKLDALS